MNKSHPLYLDWAASAPPDPEVIDRMKEVSLEFFGNPSSIHKAGRDAEYILEDARNQLASIMGCQSEELIFTSGGTEANNMIVFSMLRKKIGKKIIVSGIEHSSVYEPSRMLEQFGFKVSFIRAEKTGFVNPEKIEKELDEKTAFVLLMLVNNETGAVQPISEVASLLDSFSKRSGRKVLLHTDAVQALGKIPLNLHELGVDSASLSAHKIGGPRGVGALCVKKNGICDFLYRGGGQESGMRPGTENLPGIAGFLMAIEKRMQKMKQEQKRVRQLMQYLINQLNNIEAAHIIPYERRKEPFTNYSPFILNVSFPPIPGEILVRALEKQGVLVSTTAACSSRKKDRFRIMQNMGISEEIGSSAIRISIGWETRQEDLEKLVTALRMLIPGLMKIAT